MEGNGRLYLLWAITYLGICATVAGSSLEVAPSDKVASVGDNVHFYCTIDGDPKFEAVAWKRRVLSGNKTVEDIFHTWPPDGKKIDETKYTFTENKDNSLETSITVKNVDFTDAGRYSCEPTSYADGAMYGSLVVVATPMIRLPTRLTEGQEADIICEVRYLGPPEMKNSGLEPLIVTRLGNKVLHGNVIRTVPPDPSQPYHLRSVHKLKMKTSLHRQKFSCAAQVHSPPLDYESTASRTLMVDFPVRNVRVSPVKKVYKLGDSVSCTAEGYPAPTVRWEMVSTRGPPGGSSVLHISHRWMCVASNVVGRVTRYANSTVVTYVDQTFIQCKDYTPIIVAVVGLLVLVVAVSSGVTGYRLAYWRGRGHRQLATDEPDNGTEMKTLEDKESEDKDTQTEQNEAVLQGVVACEGIEDDSTKSQPQSTSSEPSTSMSTTMDSTEPAQTIDENGEPLCEQTIEDRS